MTKLKDSILNPIFQEDGSIKLPRALKFREGSYSQAIFWNDGRNPRNKGKVIDEIMDAWDSHALAGQEVALGEFYVDKHTLLKHDDKERVISTVSDAQLWEMDLEELVISRAIAKITLSGIHPDFSSAIAYNLNEKGDQFATGSDIHVCSNFTILHADQLYSTYEKARSHNGHTTFDLPYILRQLKRHMKETGAKMEESCRQIEGWKNRPVSKRRFNEFLGEHYSKVQVANHYRVQRRIKELAEEEKTLPLTGLQLSRIAVEAAKPSHEAYEWQGDETNLWSIVNFGTGVLKFQNGSDSTTVLKANREWVKLVDGYFVN